MASSRAETVIKSPTVTIDRPRMAKGAGAAHVYQTLRAQILSLELAPGTNLDEATLVEQSGLSRTPVREALIRLAADDLITMLPNRGAQVAPVDLTDLPRYIEAFDLAQRAVTRLAALRRTEAHLEQIRAARDDFEALIGNSDPLKQTESNRDFHLAIAVAADNLYLARHYERLLNEGMRLLRIPFAYEPDPQSPLSLEQHLDAIVAEHRDITEAIAAGDAEQAERLGHAHTELFRGRVMEYLGQNQTAEMTLG